MPRSNRRRLASPELAATACLAANLRARGALWAWITRGAPVRTCCEQVPPRCGRQGWNARTCSQAWRRPEASAQAVAFHARWRSDGWLAAHRESCLLESDRVRSKQVVQRPMISPRQTLPGQRGGARSAAHAVPRTRPAGASRRAARPFQRTLAMYRSSRRAEWREPANARSRWRPRSVALRLMSRKT